MTSEEAKTEKSLKHALAGRRQAVFSASVLLASFSIFSLCFCPIIFPIASTSTLFPTEQQESFFFDLFGFIGASWLLCWVATINEWTQASKLGQWLGLLFLCVDQVALIAVWNSAASDQVLFGFWIPPMFLQVYLLGSFFGFFTLPGLTKDGNRSLTGLGTLAILMPWLVARDEIIAGTQVLHGIFFR